MKKVFNWGVLAFLCLGLLACQGPVLLTQDGYNAAKYNLPPTLNPGGSKTVSVGASSDGWVFIPVTSGTYYLVTATGASGVTLSIYRADKTTAYVTSVAASSSPGFLATATENAFVKISSKVATQVTLSCSAYVGLTPGVWLNDTLGPGTSLRYAFPVVAGTSYDFNMNNSSYGDGTKTADTVATIYHSDRKTTYVSLVTSAFGTPTTFVATATETVFIAVSAYSSYSGGTFAIRCQLTAPPTELTSGVWRNDTIAASGTLWYSFPATAGTMYDFNMNNSYYGDQTKTAYTIATLYHADHSTPYVSSVSSAYSTPKTFTPTVSETVYVKVTNDNSGAGTFAIRLQPTPIAALTSGTWQNDTIASNGNLWYSFPVTAGTMYDFNMNNLTNGDGTKNSYTTATLYHADLSTPYVSSVSSAYSTPKTFTPTVSETVYIIVTNYYSAGTFAIRLQPTPIAALTSGTWQNDTIASNGNLWYSFPVTAGTMYDFNMNNSYNGDQTKKAYTTATIYHADRSTTYASSVTSAYATPQTFTPTVSETVYVKITNPNYSTSGTFAIRLQPSQPPTVLTSGTWRSDTLSAGGTKWYSFDAVAGTAYSISWNDSISGNSTMSCDVAVSAFRSDKATAFFTSVDSGYAAPSTITPTVSEKIYLKVAGYSPSSSGTFAIRFQ